MYSKDLKLSQLCPWLILQVESFHDNNLFEDRSKTKHQGQDSVEETDISGLNILVNSTDNAKCMLCTPSNADPPQLQRLLLIVFGISMTVCIIFFYIALLERNCPSATVYAAILSAISGIITLFSYFRLVGCCRRVWVGWLLNTIRYRPNCERVALYSQPWQEYTYTCTCTFLLVLSCWD